MQAGRDLVAAILDQSHHNWRGISACRKVMDAHEECNCGRDAHVERLLRILAGALFPEVAREAAEAAAAVVGRRQQR